MAHLRTGTRPFQIWHVQFCHCHLRTDEYFQNKERHESNSEIAQNFSLQIMQKYLSKHNKINKGIMSPSISSTIQCIKYQYHHDKQHDIININQELQKENVMIHSITNKTKIICTFIILLILFVFWFDYDLNLSGIRYLNCYEYDLDLVSTPWLRLTATWAFDFRDFIIYPFL